MYGIYSILWKVRLMFILIWIYIDILGTYFSMRVVDKVVFVLETGPAENVAPTKMNRVKCMTTTGLHTSNFSTFTLWLRLFVRLLALSIVCHRNGWSSLSFTLLSGQKMWIKKIISGNRTPQISVDVNYSACFAKLCDFSITTIILHTFRIDVFYARLVHSKNKRIKNETAKVYMCS